jgi:hypothetical protein
MSLAISHLYGVLKASCRQHQAFVILLGGRQAFDQISRCQRNKQRLESNALQNVSRRERAAFWPAMT